MSLKAERRLVLRTSGGSYDRSGFPRPIGAAKEYKIDRTPDPHASVEGCFYMLTSPISGLRHLQPDWFILSLISTLSLASLLPCSGTAARIFQVLGACAIGSLFFLQGARLSRESVLSGITHWRLHLTIAATTFILFPTIGWLFSHLFPQLLPPEIWLGVMFLCTLPSTIQAPIALTSIANGNVAGAVCWVAFSNVAGI